ncbi:DNA repair-scaffolding protein [Bienertia sinuspersici]
MWRHQSFSDNCVSLAETSDKKKKGLNFSSEDEVEVPNFHSRNLDCKSNVGCGSIISKADGSNCHPDEGTSERKKMLFNSATGGNNVSEMLDLYTKGNKKQFEPCTSYEVDAEARRVDQLNENARWYPFYSKDKNTGSRCKTKRSSSQKQPFNHEAFRSVWKDRDLNSSSDDELLDETEASQHPHMDRPSTVSLEGCDGETSKSNLSSLALPMEAALQHDHHRHSMAELLDNRQGKIRVLELKSKKGVRRKGPKAVVRNMSSSGKDTRNDEDPCEFLHGGSSTDNEDTVQISEHAIMDCKRKTMADKFQEAFGSASADDRRPLFTRPKQSRLQFIMQQQKEKDAEFLKKVQNEVWPKDEARCIDVKILSRSFDAKLSVCRCSLLDNEESSLHNPQLENFGKIWTVIFNSKVCGDVDLEVGNLIRIYPPWKEVQVLRGGEIIILAIYFSQIHT